MASTAEYISIVAIVEDKIITNHDVKKEVNYLKILNPQISQLEDKQISGIAKNSLINEIIKINEIKKKLDTSKESDLINDYIKSFYTKLNFSNETDFKNYLNNSSSYSFKEVREKIKMEMMWNELIFLKYSDQVNINKKTL